MITQNGHITPTLAPQDIRFLYDRGFNLVPLVPGTKRAAESWKGWQTRRQEWNEVVELVSAGGIAGINGVSGLRSFDFDESGYEPVARLLELLELPEMYQWIVRSGTGYHIWVCCSDTLRIKGGTKSCYVGRPIDSLLHFKQLELRWERSYTVLPPSRHPTNPEAYAWVHGRPVGEVAVVKGEDIERTFFSLADLQREPTAREELGDGPLSRGANAVLERELETLRNAREGTRNTQLNKAAFSLGQVVAAGGGLDANTVEDRLAEVARESGLGDDEIYATIQSGLKAGMAMKLATFEATDAGNAEAVVSLYGDAFLYNGSFGWMYWTGTHWQRDDDKTRIGGAVIDTLRQRQSEAFMQNSEAVAKVARADTGKIHSCISLLRWYLWESVSSFDSDPDLLNCANGVVSLRTGELVPHHPGQRFTYVVPIEYDRDADYSHWVDFLREVVGGGTEMLDYLQMAIGYSLTGLTSEEIMFYLFGPTRAGKGTVAEVILALIPYPIAMGVDFNTFTAKRDGNTNNFDLAEMKASRIVFAGESNRYQTLNAAKIKQLTGGDPVRASFKGKDLFSYTPRYKIWLLSNHPVNADPDDDGLWGRVHVIPFPNSFLGKEDLTLKARMKSPEVLRGVLRWAVEGAMHLYATGRLPVPSTIREETGKHRSQLDSVQSWLDDCAERDLDAWTNNQVAYTSYEEWCRENDVNAIEHRKFALSLKAKGFLVSVTRWEGHGGSRKQARGVQGLRLR